MVPLQCRFNALAVDRVQTRNTKNSYDVIFIGTGEQQSGISVVCLITNGCMVGRQICILTRFR